MNRELISQFVDDLFKNINQTKKVIEQKEELRSHIIEHVNDNMQKGFSFEDAFEVAKHDLGDLSELIQEFAKKEDEESENKHLKKLKKLRYIKRFLENGEISDELDEAINDFAIKIEHDAKYRSLKWKRRKKSRWDFAGKIIPLSPFIYVIIGLFLGIWQWWAFGWMIIPMTAIFFSEPGLGRLIPLSPFIYVIVGILLGIPQIQSLDWVIISARQWWIFGWMIIPIAAILFSGKKSPWY